MGNRAPIIVAVIAVLALCGLAAWLVLDVGCDRFADAVLFRDFCGKSSLGLAAAMLGIVAAVLVVAAVAQSRDRGS